MKIAVVTDSTSDISPPLAEQHQVEVIPTILVIDNQGVQDGQGMSREEYYTRLPGMASLPTTAAPASGVFQQVYERLLAAGFEHILSIHVSSALSGVLNAAAAAAEAFRGRITVVDSLQVSMGLGFQALAAAEAARRRLALQAILALLEDVRRRTRLAAMLDTLEYVRRSGRVSWARAALGSLLNIKPFLEVRDGRVLRLGEARSRHKGLARLAELLRAVGPLERLAILHTNAEADARQLLEEFAPELPSPPLVVNVTTVIGTHVGPNCVGFVALGRG
jgi:DegV family protein with EDD domain